ncbi:jhy protein homolog [Eleutherodactylus coqui]|uniref:Jhy protein homolog n=1 Tax=Eleutherodactylus coqui TaxID=57060 RepID=A0A8J6F8B8_ELECQ|nr:hypothetical protein GDO78_011207 [Eleutherodactylus coqui]
METDNAVQSLHSPVSAGGDMDLGLSSDSLEDSDTDSLCEERQYQSELQNRIHGNQEDILQTKEEHQGEATAGETEDCSHQGQGAKSKVRQQEIRTSYSELRYDPNWRKHQNLLHTSDQDEEEFRDVSSIDSERWSPDEVVLDTSEDRNNVDSHLFWKPLTDVTCKNKKITATTKQKSKAGGQIRRHAAYEDGTDKKIMKQGEVPKKDIIEKNKVTLGVRKEKKQSYLHIHIKNIEENTSGQLKEKSDAQPTEEGSHLGKDGKLFEVIKESGLAGSQIQLERPKTLYMADVNASQWDDMPLYSGEYDNEYLTIASYPDRYKESLRGSLGPHSSQEDLQIHNEGPYYQNIRLPERRYDHYIMETMGGTQDSMEMYMYPRLFQIGAQTQPEVPGMPYSTHSDIFIPSQITPQTCVLTAKSTKSNNEPEGGNERTRLCPAGVRKKEEKRQKKLKSFLNQEVKLGGLGPVHTVSEEKKEQLKQQKEYAKVIQEQNRNRPVKPRGIQVMHNDKNKSTRQKSLDYAKKVPRPQPVPKVCSEKTADIPEKRAASCDSLFPQMKLLEDLQIRHEKEKMAVAALSALHIL